MYDKGIGRALPKTAKRKRQKPRSCTPQRATSACVQKTTDTHGSDIFIEYHCMKEHFDHPDNLAQDITSNAYNIFKHFIIIY